MIKESFIFKSCEGQNGRIRHMLAETGRVARSHRLVLGLYVVIFQQEFPHGRRVRMGVCTALPFHGLLLKRQHPGDLAGKRGPAVSSFIYKPAVIIIPALA